ncbi:hypothetical protein VCRA2113O415_630002 [Vibrio crassostreae]|nr:hypothetical protein VCRA2113O415_630002 [Vibrio crassostreae]CAK2919863.1 hypothetical protein VCRA2113O420_590002 [Vibrio crassostreae]CAK3486524.1 hypothetical protein VCRA2121O436_440028 [Vibrio crassostreae]
MRTTAPNIPKVVMTNVHRKIIAVKQPSETLSTCLTNEKNVVQQFVIATVFGHSPPSQGWE